MEDLEALIQTLEKSVEKNGSIPLTTGHLLNILKVVDRHKQRMEDYYNSIEDCPF